jgi:hypothetical protein
MKRIYSHLFESIYSEPSKYVKEPDAIITAGRILSHIEYYISKYENNSGIYEQTIAATKKCFKNILHNMAIVDHIRDKLSQHIEVYQRKLASMSTITNRDVYPFTEVEIMGLNWQRVTICKEIYDIFLMQVEIYMNSIEF